MSLIAVVLEGSDLMPILLECDLNIQFPWQRSNTCSTSWLVLYSIVCEKLAVNGPGGLLQICWI